MVSVILMQWVGCDGKGKPYVRRKALPVAPSAGLGVCLDDGDPYEINHVFVNLDGDVVCDLGRRDYRATDFDDEGGWPAQLQYHTDGWLPLGESGRDRDCYRTPPELKGPP